jgi:hypothetical protein
MRATERTRLRVLDAVKASEGLQLISTERDGYFADAQKDRSRRKNGRIGEIRPLEALRSLFARF